MSEQEKQGIQVNVEAAKPSGSKNPSFRQEVLPAMEELLEVLEKAAMSIKSESDALAMSEELVGIGKHVSNLNKSLKSNKTTAPQTPQGKKIKKAFGKVISISAKHEVTEDDAKKMISAIKQYTAKITSRTNEHLNKEKDRFTFN